MREKDKYSPQSLEGGALGGFISSSLADVTGKYVLRFNTKTHPIAHLKQHVQILQTLCLCVLNIVFKTKTKTKCSGKINFNDRLFATRRELTMACVRSEMTDCVNETQRDDLESNKVQEHKRIINLYFQCKLCLN